MRNSIAFVVSILAGFFLIVSGTRGPIGIYELILPQLPLFTGNALILTVAALVLLFLIIMSSLGGFVVIIGGYLIHRNHVLTGKLTIGLGAGVGIPWLLFILLTVAVTQDFTSVIAQHSLVGWTGIILSFIARYMGKASKREKPKTTGS
jgi:hypothetical protein